MKKIFPFAFLLLIIINNSNAFCEHANNKKGKKVLYVGVLGLVVPKYYGANKYRFLPVPNFRFEYGEHFVISPYRGISFSLNHLKPFKFDFGIRYKFWFRSNRSSRFSGVSNLKPYIESYIISKYRFRPLSFSIGIYHAVNKLDVGGFIRAGCNYFIRVNEKFNIFMGPSTKISNKKHMQALYSVSKEESVSASIPEYDLNAGFEDVRFNTGITYQFNEKWNTHLMFSIKHLLGDAAKSPLIQNKYQFFANISINYKI